MNALETFAASGVVPIVTIDDAGVAVELGDALQAGGLACVEITLRTGAALKAIEQLKGRKDLVVGAGTVRDEAQVDHAIDAGADFVVSPGLDATVVTRSRHHGIAAIPGIATPTELLAAWRLGLDTVKFFPAVAMGGLPTLAALGAVLPEMRFIPTGGLHEEDLPRYLENPRVLAVGGSWIADQQLLSTRDWSEVERRARVAVACVSVARKTGDVHAIP